MWASNADTISRMARHGQETGSGTWLNGDFVTRDGVSFGIRTLCSATRGMLAYYTARACNRSFSRTPLRLSLRQLVSIVARRWTNPFSDGGALNGFCFLFGSADSKKTNTHTHFFSEIKRKIIICLEPADPSYQNLIS
jgi:hypothetical protein